MCTLHLQHISIWIIHIEVLHVVYGHHMGKPRCSRRGKMYKQISIIVSPCAEIMCVSVLYTSSYSAGKEEYSISLKGNFLWSYTINICNDAGGWGTNLQLEGKP